MGAAVLIVVSVVILAGCFFCLCRAAADADAEIERILNGLRSDKDDSENPVTKDESGKDQGIL